MSTFDWKKILQLGLIGGLVGVLIALVGMVEEFDERDIIAGTLSMGWTMLILTVLITAYFAAGISKMNNLLSIAAGALSGAVFSVVMSILTWMVDTFDLRQTLVNASPNLV